MRYIAGFVFGITLIVALPLWAVGLIDEDDAVNPASGPAVFIQNHTSAGAWITVYSGNVSQRTVGTGCAKPRGYWMWRDNGSQKMPNWPNKVKVEMKTKVDCQGSTLKELAQDVRGRTRFVKTITMSGNQFVW